MTVTASYSPDSYNGDGSTVIFPYTFKIFAEGDLTVVQVGTDGTETVKTLTTDYSVSGVGVASGGNVTILKPRVSWIHISSTTAGMQMRGKHLN